jgi:hypothetical protein
MRAAWLFHHTVEQLVSCSRLTLSMRPPSGLQVCALQWNRHERELLSSHGFSQNQLCLWRYPSMTKVRPSAPRVPAAPGSVPLHRTNMTCAACHQAMCCS